MNEDNIARLICGGEYGTAVLTDSDHAITVYHCIRKAYEDPPAEIKLQIVVAGTGKEITASVIGTKNHADEEDEYVYLQLKESVENIDAVKFMSCNIEPFQKIHMLGYGENRPDVSWVKLQSTGRTQAVAGQKHDIQLEAEYAKDKTFAGFSGSPLMDKEDAYILGLTVQEGEVNKEVLYIKGVSVKSQLRFFDRHGISVEIYKAPERNMAIKPKITQNVGFNATGMSDVGYDPYNAILDGIILLHHKGYKDEAQRKLKEQIGQLQNAKNVPDKVKAQFLIKQAIWILEDARNVAAANKAYHKAVQYDESLDARAFLALRSFYSDGKDARKLVMPVDSLYLLNIYMQICVNQNDGTAAINMYELNKDLYGRNDTTLYLLSIAYMLQREFKNAEKTINMAMEENTKIADYYFIRALIKYWSAVPCEIYDTSNTICPELYFKGIFFLPEDMRIEIKKAAVDFKCAYNIAYGLQDQEKTENFLTCWINALTIDNSLFPDTAEPLELLRNENPDHTVVLLLDLLCDKVKRDEKYEKKLRTLIKKKENTINYIIILTEYYLVTREPEKAKSLLFEYKNLFMDSSNMVYWYDEIARLETDNEKRRAILDIIRKDTSLSEIQRRRISCLFENSSNQNMLQELESIYKDTGLTLDIINVILCGQETRNWNKSLEYARILKEKHHNYYGYLYEMNAYYHMEKYADAYRCVQDIEKLGIDELSQQVQINKIDILEKIGEYNQAISAGEELFPKIQTEDFAHRLANLYIKTGDQLGAIRVLQDVERKNELSPIGYQRLSGYFQFMDAQKSLEYAEKYVESSKHSPGALAWAATSAANIGRSDVMERYWLELMSNHPDSENIKPISLEEFTDMLKNTNMQRHECLTKYNHAEIPLHVYLDVMENVLLSGMFYDNWDNTEHFSMSFFGGLYIKMNSDINLDKIVLDYTSCLLLNELNMFDILASNVSTIYVPSNINLVIFEEQTKLCWCQSDLLQHQNEVLEYCMNILHLEFVKYVYPDNLSGLNFTKQYENIRYYTAQKNDAIWVDTDRNSSYAVSVDEVYAALSVIGYSCSYNADKIRPEKVELLKCQGCELLISILAAQELFDNNMLDNLCNSYEVFLFEEDKIQIITELGERNKKRTISNKLELMKNKLKEFTNSGKIKWCADINPSENIYCDLLTSAITTAIQENIPYCVEDRCIQSYGLINSLPIYSTLHLLKIMHDNEWINDNQYLKSYREFINRKVGFIVISEQLIYQGLFCSSVVNGNLTESRQLSIFRVYMEQSLYLLDKYSGTYQIGAHFSEKKCYLVMHILNLRKIIELIWESDMELERKTACSDWVILMYSRFGESISETAPEDLSKDTLIIIPIAQLILQSTLFLGNVNEIPNYSKWLYSLFSDLLEVNDRLLGEIVAVLLREIHNSLRRYQNKSNELFIIERSMSHGIQYMPDFLREKVLEDLEINMIYQKFYKQVVHLSQDCYIPHDILEKWIQDALETNEYVVMEKKYDNSLFKISWEYSMPLWPLFKISWFEKEKEYLYQLYCEPGVRLQHGNTSVRIKEVRNTCGYLGCDIDWDVIEQISTDQYANAVNLLKAKVFLSDKFINELIQKIVREGWIFELDSANYLLPFDISYFQQYYEYESSFICDNPKIISSIPIQLEKGLVFEKTLNPIRRLHFLSWIMQNNRECNEDEFGCMLDYMEGGCDFDYGQTYISILRIVYYIMQVNEKYVSVPVQDRMIWTYIWADKIFDEIIACIHSGISTLSEYQKNLSQCAKNIIPCYTSMAYIETLDVIDPSQINITRICLLGSIQLYTEFWSQDRHQEIQCNIRRIGERLDSWLKSYDTLYEFLISHENSRNEWKTFFNKNYRKEINRLQVIAFQVNDDNLLSENDQEDIQRILGQESLSIIDKSIILLKCMSKPDHETIILLERFLQKFFLDLDTMSELNDYILATVILMRLPNETNEKLKRELMLNLKSKLLYNMEDWRKIIGFLVYIVGDDLNLYVQFFEMISSEPNIIAEPDFLSWLTEQQLMLPLNLGWKLYQAKAHLINRKYETYETE